jgi:hypothetical protein
MVESFAFGLAEADIDGTATAIINAAHDTTAINFGGMKLPLGFLSDIISPIFHGTLPLSLITI